jgi:hypothetical protein
MFAFSFLKKTFLMKQNISLQELIAYNNPSKAKALVVKYGYRPARNYNDLIQKLFRLTKEHREDALKDLVDIHPHKDLIIHYAMPVSVPVATETKSSANGDNTSDCQCPSCQIARIKMYSNFEGNEPNSKESIKDYIPIILVGGFVTLIMLGALKRVG